MYICGLDISERVIHGCVIENGGGHTVKHFCIPRKLAHLRAELEAILDDVGQAKSLRLCASDYGHDIQELLDPLWQVGYLRAIALQNSTVDRLLLRAYHLQQAHWDRAHLLASLAREQHCYEEPVSRHKFCLQWAWLRTREKIHHLQLRRNGARRPDWLREITRCTISTTTSPPDQHRPIFP